MFFQSLPFSFLPAGGHELILNPSMLTQAECLPSLCSQPRLPQPTHSTLSVPAVDPFKLQDSPCYRCYRIKGCCKIKRSPFEYNHRCPPSVRLFTLWGAVYQSLPLLLLLGLVQRWWRRGRHQSQWVICGRIILTEIKVPAVFTKAICNFVSLSLAS